MSMEKMANEVKGINGRIAVICNNEGDMNKASDLMKIYNDLQDVQIGLWGIEVNKELQKGHDVAKCMAAIKAYGKDEESEMDNISGVAINTIRDLIGNEELKIKVDNGYELECLVDLLKSSGLEHEGGYSFIKVYGVWTGFNIYGFLYDEHRFNKTEAIEINLNNGECIPTENISSTEILRNMISIAKWREQTGMGEMIESYGSKKTYINYLKESIGKKVESGVNGMFRTAGSSMRVAFVENKFVPWKEVK